MFWSGVLFGIVIGFILALIGQRGVEKAAIENGCVKLDGIMFELLPWRKGGKN